ncbi:MAG: hypothetical protein AAF985_03130 [Bacteroidota bacterium]
MSKKQKIRQKILWIEVLLISACLLLYGIDFLLGDGDGIIDQLSFNPLLFFLIWQTVLLPIFLMTSQREKIVGLGVFLFSVIFCLFIVEFFLDVVLAKSSSTVIESHGNQVIYSRYDSIYFKNYLPNRSFVTHLKEGEVLISILNRINSQGIRGPEIGAKKEREQRTILLGDSFLQSDEVTYEQSIGQQLELLLGDSSRVIQHGQPSWSPLLEFNWLLRKTPILHPDRLVLFLYYNDFFHGNSVGDAGYTPYARFDAKGYPQSFVFDDVNTPKRRNLWTHFLERMSYLSIWRRGLDVYRRYVLHQQIPASEMTTLLTMSAQDFEGQTISAYERSNLYFNKILGKLSVLRDTTIWDQATRKRVALTEHYLERMHHYLKHRNIELVIALIPSPWQLSDENKAGKKFYDLTDYQFPRGGLEQVLETFCQQNQIPFCPLYPAFKAFDAQDTSPLYYDQDGHWTPRGHRLAAETLAHFFNTLSPKPNGVE